MSQISIPFQPQVENPKAVLETIVSHKPSLVLDGLWWSMYDAGGFSIGDAMVIRDRLIRAAENLLLILKDQETEYFLKNL